MFCSPILALIIGMLWMFILYVVLSRVRVSLVNRTFRPMQIFSAAFLGFSHGSNDAQKTMGIVTLALFSATAAGELAHVPPALAFLRTPEFEVALWVKLLCAFTMASGTAVGGRRIIKTLGRRLAKLQPVSGFAADSTSATVLLTAARLGMPVSTTHAVSTAIMGVAMARNFKAMRWEVVEGILWTWVFTLPVTAGLAYGLMSLFHVLFGAGL